MKNYILILITLFALNVNGQYNLGLGGSLKENTSIYMGGYNYFNTSILPSFLGGASPYGLINGHSISGGCGKSLFSNAFNNLNYTAFSSNIDTCSGSMNSTLGYGNLVSGQRRQILADYDNTNGGLLHIDLLSDINNPLASSAQILFGDNTFVGSPSPSIIKIIRANGYLGDYIRMSDDANITIFAVKENGITAIKAPKYDDDADAAANGVLQNEIFQTSATNTLGLPAGVLMIKQ